MSKITTLSRLEDLIPEHREEALNAYKEWSDTPFAYGTEELFITGPVILCELFTFKVTSKTKSGLIMATANSTGKVETPEIVFPKVKVLKVSSEVEGDLSQLYANQIVDIPYKYTINKINDEWKAWAQLAADTAKERPAPVMQTPEPPRLVGFVSDLEKYKYYHDYENLLPNIYLLPASLIIGYGRFTKVEN